jgi:inositol transport system substrate-binding protein
MAKKFGLKVAAVALAAASVLTACSSSGTPAASGSAATSGGATKTLKIGVTFPILDQFLQKVADAITAEAKAKGVEVTIVAADEKTDTQLGQVENFVSQKVDGIIVIPVDTDAADPMTQAAQTAKIPLVYVNRNPSNLPDGVPYVGSDSLYAGTVEMEQLAKLAGGKGNVFILQGDPANEAAVQRTKGCNDVVAKNPGMKVIATQAGNWYREKGQSITENWLSGNTEINVVCANNDEMALGAINAIKAAGKKLGTGGILVGGVDATSDALAAMKAGDLSVTVFQDAAGQGKGGVDAVISLANGEKVDAFVNIPYQLVTPENMAQFASK